MIELVINVTTVTKKVILQGIVLNLRKFIRIVVCVSGVESQAISSVSALNQTQDLRKANLAIDLVVKNMKRGSINTKRRKLKC